MHSKTRLLFFFFLLLINSLLLESFVNSRSGITINSGPFLNSVLESISKIKTMRYDLQRNERIKGKMNYTESKVKLQISPRKLYISLDGPEVLWIAGTNNGNALVNPGSFPYISLNLDPMGSLMRKNQHHTINELGMAYVGEILKDGMKHFGDQLDKHFVILGEEKYMGRDCYKLSAAFPDFAWQSYTATKGETVLSIANRLHLNEYLILENNPGIGWYNDVISGKTIKLPSAYAKLFMLMIDKELMLPISEKIYDDKGLFETYEYYNLKVNPIIAPEEFTKDYKGYNF